MKILAFADLHGNLSSMRKIKSLCDKQDPDIIIVAGDFTVFEAHIHHIMKWIASLGKEAYIIPGNHETEEVTRFMCKKYKLHYCHNAIVNIDDVLFVFHGGGGFAQKDRQFMRLWKNNGAKVKSAEKVVLVTHAPPYGTVLDKVYGHVGNKDYRDFIVKNKKCILAISGHIHETIGRSQKLSHALIANPGPQGKVFVI